MIDKKLTEWLYYITPYRDALDIGELKYPKYLELNFPYKYQFTDYLLECSLKEFVSVMIWIFRDRYPYEYSTIQVLQAKKDEKNDELLFNTNKRKLQDIEPLDFEEVGNFDLGLLSLKIKFKQPQISVFNWVEQAIKGKTFEKIESPETSVYSVSESPIEKLEVTKNHVFIKIKEDYLIY